MGQVTLQCTFPVVASTTPSPSSLMLPHIPFTVACCRYGVNGHFDSARPWAKIDDFTGVRLPALATGTLDA